MQRLRPVRGLARSRSYFRNTAPGWRLSIAISRSESTSGRGRRRLPRVGSMSRIPQLGITFRRELLAEQNSITLQNLKPWLLEFASRNNLDQKGILDSLSDQRLGALVDQERQAAVARGISHTPTAFVGGQAFVETIIYEDIARALDEALAK